MPSEVDVSYCVSRDMACHVRKCNRLILRMAYVDMARHVPTTVIMTQSLAEDDGDAAEGLGAVDEGLFDVGGLGGSGDEGAKSSLGHFDE